MSFEDDFEKPFENSSGHSDGPDWSVLRELCEGNCEALKTQQDENAVRIKAALTAILDHLEQLRLLYQEISEIAPLFDFDSQTPGNGYRSFLVLVDKIVSYSEGTCRQFHQGKSSIFFRKGHHMREIESCSQVFVSLCTCLQHIKTLYTWSDAMDDGRPSLFSSEEHEAKELLSRAETINQYCFYGRCLGFQFCGSLQNCLKILSASLASFSEMYYSNGTVLGRCANSLKYMLDPEARARRIVNLSHYADIHFCQSYWFLNEMAFFPIVLTSLAINQIISIPPEELILPNLDGKNVSIPIPCSHTGKKPIHVRLLSFKRRIGMVGSAEASGELFAPSDSLIIHCHGGGFVAQTSKSHEVYLRRWAVALGVPILSVDYSLAPQAPYPRALEEVIYTYCWALKHCNTLLGTTAKKIILAGDSAGANLNLGTTMRLLDLNIRKPDGLFMAYVPVLVEFIPSPSRLLCLTDPMLPFGFMMRCLKAYTAADSNDDVNQREKDIENGMDSGGGGDGGGGGGGKSSDTEESFAEVSESDLIALALSPNGNETNEEHKLASLPSDSTLNSVSLAEVDVAQCTEINGDSRVNDTSRPTQSNEEDKRSQEYIQQFLDLYKNSSFGASSTQNVPNGSTGNVAVEDDAPRASSSVDKSWSFFGFRRESKMLDMGVARNPTEELVFTVPRDPFLSPFRASDDVLRQLPPTKILSMELDPCLDDSVMFARKLKQLGICVSLDILSNLPHGFLNLVTISKEANEGSELCIKRIQELLDL